MKIAYKIVVRIPNQILSGDQMRMRLWGWHVAGMGSGQTHIGGWWGNVRQRGHLEDGSVMASLNGILFKTVSCAWTGLNWLRIGIIGGFLSTR